MVLVYINKREIMKGIYMSREKRVNTTIGRSHFFNLLIVVGVLLGISIPVKSVEVIFPDANLESAVRDELGIPAPNPIADTDMQTLGSFNATSSDIYNMQGLEYASNLTSLNLGYNQVSDIAPVSGLTNLTYLGLFNNQIVNISGVSGLTNLTTLQLAFNKQHCRTLRVDKFNQTFSIQ